MPLADPNLLFWAASLANLALVVGFALQGVRRIRQRDVRGHRRLMVTASSLDEEIDAVWDRIAAVDPGIPLILQPVTPFGPVRERVEPPADADAVEQLARLRRAVDALDAYDGPLPEHPLLGPFTRDDWRKFHLRHCELHLGHLVVRGRPAAG